MRQAGGAGALTSDPRLNWLYQVAGCSLGQRAILLWKIGHGRVEGTAEQGRLTSFPRLNSLNQEPGFSLGQEVILA